eukprot:CAMPEP_0115134778 /NCGR_PEP_ID=MMETSP0227-20121206/55300_1 /TAXON_ID=89957 /ORGANISM="Polarella glacialis, Strain CCMP 1383" /LENGTH=134 /DNA_ID=CAMNT_0002541325 /DNA_START=271 /DNA_END=673 /DNA_ORIENTATION=-
MARGAGDLQASPTGRHRSRALMQPRLPPSQASHELTPVMRKRPWTAQQAGFCPHWWRLEEKRPSPPIAIEEVTEPVLHSWDIACGVMQGFMTEPPKLLWTAGGDNNESPHRMVGALVARAQLRRTELVAEGGQA